MLKFQIDIQKIFFNAVKYKNHITIVLISILILTIAGITFTFFQNKKKALISGQIAVGFAYLEEGKKDIALYNFEQAFNNSSGFYKVISGVGVAKSIPSSSSQEEQILNVLSLIQNHAKNSMINNLINAVFLSNQSAFKKEDLKESELKKFETFALKSNFFFFREVLLNIYLNLNQNQKFEAESVKLKTEIQDFENTRKFNLKERNILLKTI